MLSSRERVETLKLRKRARLSPIPKGFLVFPVKRRPSPCAMKKDPKHYIFMCLCACPPAQHTPQSPRCDPRVHERDGWGASGTWRWPPLTHAFPPPRLHLQLPGDGCSEDLSRNVMEVPVRMVTTHGVTGADGHPSVC